MPNLSDGFSTEEVAERLGVSDRTVRNYCKNKLLEHYRMGNRIIIMPDDLEKFIKNLKVKKESNENE